MEKLIHIGRNKVNIKKEKYEIGDIVFVSKYKYNNGEDGNNHLFLFLFVFLQIIGSLYIYCN